VQDSLITVLSEKSLPVPELNLQIRAIPGFTIIGTANDRDRGVNQMSSALARRFNTVVLPPPATEDAEVEIVASRSAQLGQALQLPAEPPALDEVRRVVRVFRELRNGTTSDGRTQLKKPSGSLSTAEAISVITNGMSLAAHFGDGRIGADEVAAGLLGAIVKDRVSDTAAWQEYLETVVKERSEWRDLYRACQELDVAGFTVGGV
jgi:MoxR-like ATPase